MVKKTDLFVSYLNIRRWFCCCMFLWLFVTQSEKGCNRIKSELSIHFSFTMRIFCFFPPFFYLFFYIKFINFLFMFYLCASLTLLLLYENLWALLCIFLFMYFKSLLEILTSNTHLKAQNRLKFWLAVSN